MVLVDLKGVVKRACFVALLVPLLHGLTNHYLYEQYSYKR